MNESNCINSGYGIRMLSEGIVTFTSTPSSSFAEKEIKKAISVSKLLTNWKKGISELADAPVTDSSVTKKPKIDWTNLANGEFEQKIKDLFNIDVECDIVEYEISERGEDNFIKISLQLV